MNLKNTTDQKQKNNGISQMLIRILTSAVGLAIFFVLLPSPDNVFAVAVLLVSLLAIFEIHRIASKSIFLTIVGLLSSSLIFAVSYIMPLTRFAFSVYLAVFTMYIMLSVFMYGREKVSTVYMLGFITIMFTCFFATIALLKAQCTAYVAFLPFLFGWITDTGAYFTGSLIGKHSLAGSISEKKTVEGAIGGFVFCLVFTYLYIIFLRKVFHVSIFAHNNFLKMSVIAIASSFVAQMGDLAASAIKRNFNVKDYGKILPGHGGILDRFDSVVFVAPFLYFLLLTLVRLHS